jgi:hypothetical protein
MPRDRWNSSLSGEVKKQIDLNVRNFEFLIHFFVPGSFLFALNSYKTKIRFRRKVHQV